MNRVRYRVFGGFAFDRELGWIPFSLRDIDRARREGLPLGRFSDPTYGYRSNMTMWRMGAMIQTPSNAAWRKFMTALDAAVQAWIGDHPEAMAEGNRIAAVEGIARLQGEAAGLRAQLDTIERQIGSLVIQELTGELQ